MINDSWNYDEHAAFYSFRPNYADSVMDRLLSLVGANRRAPFLVADVGAGTGNLTALLLARGLRCIAIEPNAEMRKYGRERIPATEVTWLSGTGEATGLGDASVQWVTMGSSFNTMDRAQALRETHRILKPGGFFTCLWNHRDLTNPFQNEIETLICRFISSYSRGTRREDQTEVIRQSGLFEDIRYLEGDQLVEQTPEIYVKAWRSTRTLKAQAGDQFETIISAIERKAREQDSIRTLYTTRSWTARKPLRSVQED